MLNLDTILSEAGAVAHDIPLWTGKTTAPKTLVTATLEDWEESCERARYSLSIGSARVEPGWTWEEAVARWGARYLRHGVIGVGAEEAMGRTTDSDLWKAQRPRWELAVYKVAARGSANLRQEEDPAGWIRSVSTGLVLTEKGMVPLSSVPREKP